MKNDVFYIRNINKITSESEIDLSFLPQLLRRRLSFFDKVSLTTMNKSYEDCVEEIVFSSVYGEFSRLDKIIKQYQECDEVSPAQFSASVHNFPAGFFTLNKKLNIPYYALTSFEAGLIKSVISGKESLCTYSDVYEDIKSISFIVSPNEGEYRFESLEAAKEFFLELD